MGQCQAGLQEVLRVVQRTRSDLRASRGDLHARVFGFFVDCFFLFSFRFLV